MPSGRRVRPLALALLVGGLVLGGCDGDEDGGSAGGDKGGTTAGVDDAGGASQAPVGPPTTPMKLKLAHGTRTATEGSGTITVEGDRAAFVLPSGNIACVMTDRTATCQVEDKSYTPAAPEMIADALAGCTVETANAMRLVQESAAWTCVSEPLSSDARLTAGGWWEPEIDGDTLKIDGARVAVLRYGDTLQVGPVSCTASENGVTCANPELDGRRFTLSRTGYSYDRGA